MRIATDQTSETSEADPIRGTVHVCCHQALVASMLFSLENLRRDLSNDTSTSFQGLVVPELKIVPPYLEIRACDLDFLYEFELVSMRPF